MKKFWRRTAKSQKDLIKGKAVHIQPFDYISQEIISDANVTNLPYAKIKPLKPKQFSYQTNRGGGISSAVNQNTIGSEYNLKEVGLLEDTEAILRQSFRRKISLMFKEGFSFVGKNSETVEYIHTRLRQIELSSNISILDLLKRIGTSLIRLSNAFIYKVRDIDNSGGIPRQIPGTNNFIPPVAGYFILPAEQMECELDNNNRVKKWILKGHNGVKDRVFSPNDIIHFTLNRKEGFIFGTPDVIPVIDDIRALRNLESNIELLLYQHLFPLYHWKVGNDLFPAGYNENGEDEIAEAQLLMNHMPAEGGLATNHRHEITTIGAEGQALKAEGYLQHFLRRVIAGLGISELDIGIADTSNRGTARSLSRQLIDTVKDIQDSVESQFNQEVIAELLMETPLQIESDVLDPENMVYLQFKEIDIENRMEQEKHAIELFKSYGITYAEYRKSLGLEPLDIPDDPHATNNQEQYPEWYQTYWKLFEEPSLLMKSIDEPWSPAAIAASEANTTNLNKSQLATAKKEQPKPPTTPSIPSKPKDFLAEYNELEEEIILALLGTDEWESGIHNLFGLWKDHVIQKLIAECEQSIELNYFANTHNGNAFFNLVQKSKQEIKDRVNHTINKLGQDLTDRLLQLENKNKREIANIFQSYRYRVRIIYNTELSKCRNYGKLLGIKANGYTHILIHGEETDCEKCKAYHNKEFEIDSFNLNNIVPFHPNCKCKFSKKGV